VLRPKWAESSSKLGTVEPEAVMCAARSVQYSLNVCKFSRNAEVPLVPAFQQRQGRL